jgi:hypothetical protein
MNWFDSLPPADARVPCGNGTHTVRWEAGQLSLPAHPDAEAELVLGALGGDKPACVTLAETWARHADDLAVLTAGPRCAADKVTITWDQVADQRANWFGMGHGTAPAASMAHGTGPASRPASFPASPATPRAAVTPRVPPGGATSGVGAPRPGGAMLPGAGAARRAARVSRLMAGRQPGADEFTRRATQRFELLELLALGPALQFRLSGTVTAAWASPSQTDARADHLPELTAALTGRFAPIAEEWLGIDPDSVTVTPHEGPGWGTLSVTGTGQASAAPGSAVPAYAALGSAFPVRRLRASLPVSWLSRVWACGLAVVDGHLVIAVDRPGYPRARVLALRSPGADPVTLDVEAAGVSAEGLPEWTCLLR